MGHVEEVDQLIKHIVMWKIHKGGTEKQKHASYLKFREKTEYLKTIIPEILEATVAYNLNEGGFDICIDSVFKSQEDLERYIMHPEHLKVRAFLDTIQYEKTSFDYEY